MIRSGLFFAATFIGAVLVASAGPAAAATFDSVGLYQSFDEMAVWAAAFEAANPDLVNVVEFGLSHQERPLLAIQLTSQSPRRNDPGKPGFLGEPGKPEFLNDPGRPEFLNAPGSAEFLDDPGRPEFLNGLGRPGFRDGPGRPEFLNDPGKPEFLFTGGVHAREVIGSEAAYRLAEYLVDSYRAGSSAAIDVLAEREVWIIPNLNPDGRIRVEDGDSRHRKNMEHISGQPWNSSARGVDLNRNFPHRWTNASSYVRSETYRGPSPLSTPEASALWDLLHDEAYFSDMMAAVDFHSGIQSILTPWISSATNPNSNPLPPADREKFDQLAGEMNAITGFPINTLSYNAYGTLTDSLYEEFGAYAVCEELYNGPFSDYFTLFNPLNQTGIDTVVTKAIDSSMFLLSDQAFALPPNSAPGFDSSMSQSSGTALYAIPEPSVLAMLFLGGIAVLLYINPKRKRGLRNSLPSLALRVSMSS